MYNYYVYLIMRYLAPGTTIACTAQLVISAATGHQTLSQPPPFGMLVAGITVYALTVALLVKISTSIVYWTRRLWDHQPWIRELFTTIFDITIVSLMAAIIIRGIGMM